MCWELAQRRFRDIGPVCLVQANLLGCHWDRRAGVEELHAEGILIIWVIRAWLVMGCAIVGCPSYDQRIVLIECGPGEAYQRTVKSFAGGADLVVKLLGQVLGSPQRGSGAPPQQLALQDWVGNASHLAVSQILQRKQMLSSGVHFDGPDRFRCEPHNVALAAVVICVSRAGLNW